MTHFEDISLSDSRHMYTHRSLARQTKPAQLSRTPTAPVATLSSQKLLPRSPARPSSNGLRTTVAVNNSMRTLNGQRSPGSVVDNALLLSRSPSLAVPVRPPRRKNLDGPPRAGTRPPFHAGTRSVTSPVSAPVRSDAGPFLPLKRTPSRTGRRKSAKEIEAEFDDLNSADEEVPDEAIIANIPISPRPQSTRSPSISPDRMSESSHSDGMTDMGRSKSWDTALSALSTELRELTIKLDSHQVHFTRRNSADNSLEYPNPYSSSHLDFRHSTSTVSTLPPIQRPNPLVDPLPVSKEKEKHLSRTRPAWLPPKSQAEEKKHLKEYKRMMDAFAEAEKRKSAESDKATPRRRSKDKGVEDALITWRSILGDWENAMNDQLTRERWWAGIPSALRGQVWARQVGNDLQLTVQSFRRALSRANGTIEHLAQAATLSNRVGHTRQASTVETIGDTRARRSLVAMEQDIATSAFPYMRLFQKGQSHYQSLKELLLAYAFYRTDTLHVRGTAGIAALLLLQHIPVSTLTGSSIGASQGLPAASNCDGTDSAPEQHNRDVYEAATAGAFIALANLLNRQMSLAFCLNDGIGKERAIDNVEHFVKIKLRRLHGHFTNLLSRPRSNPDASKPVDKENAQPGDARPILRDITNPLAQSLMTTVLTVDEAARLLDIIVFEGDGIIVRGIVGIMGRCESSLYGSQAEINRVLGWQSSGAPTSKGEDNFVKWVQWAGREDAAAPR